MNAHEHLKLGAGHRTKRSSQALQRADILARMVKTFISALIGTVLISLFSIVIMALLIKAFMTSDDMSFQLLNSAMTLVGTALGAVLGYFLGRNSNDKPEQRP